MRLVLSPSKMSPKFQTVAIYSQQWKKDPAALRVQVVKTPVTFLNISRFKFIFWLTLCHFRRSWFFQCTNFETGNLESDLVDKFCLWDLLFWISISVSMNLTFPLYSTAARCGWNAGWDLLAGLHFLQHFLLRMKYWVKIFHAVPVTGQRVNITQTHHHHHHHHHHHQVFVYVVVQHGVVTQ